MSIKAIRNDLHAATIAIGQLDAKAVQHCPDDADLTAVMTQLKKAIAAVHEIYQRRTTTAAEPAATEPVYHQTVGYRATVVTYCLIRRWQRRTFRADQEEAYNRFIAMLIENGRDYTTRPADETTR